MKKFIITGLSVLLLAGCGAPQEKEDAQSKQEEKVVNASNENIVVFPEGAVPVGEGKVKVITPDGTSENGNIPAVFIKKDTLIQQVELELSNFQNDKETFIFVDQYMQINIKSLVQHRQQYN